MAIDRLRMIHQQWLEQQQVMNNAVEGSRVHKEARVRIIRLRREASQIDLGAKDAFAREFLERYHVASPEGKQSLQAQQSSPALIEALPRLHAAHMLQEQTPRVPSPEPKKQPAIQHKSLYEGCNHEVFLAGNVAGIKRIGADMRSRFHGRPHDAAALADIQQAVGRTKNDEVMTPKQATESLLRTAKKLFIRLNDNGRHAKWEKPTQAEKDLWQDIEEIVKMRMVRKILDNDTNPNVILLKRLVDKYVPQERRARELQGAYSKWVDAVFHEALAPQEVLREFGGELNEWRKEHAQDKQAPLEAVPAYKYDMPQEQNGLQEVEITRSIFDLFEMKALVGLALANNNWKLRFKGTDFGQFVIPEGLMNTLRDQFSKTRSHITELQEDTVHPMPELRRQAMQKLVPLLDGPTEYLEQQTLPASSLDADEQEAFDKLIREFLNALKHNSKKLGGAEAMSEFMLAEKIIAVSNALPKSAFTHVDKESIAVWEASPGVVAAIIAPNQ